MVTIKRFDSALWPVLFVLSLVPGWLLPNHYPPWTTFHLDAWIAGVLALAALVLIWHTSAPVSVHGVTLMVSALALLPGIQYRSGQLATAGNAWVCTAYLLGLALALMTGARWESVRAGHLADCLFGAIGVAAIISVGLQFHQWLTLDGLDLWSMGASFLRPHANFGQPNQLASFLLWGLLALGWGVLRGKIGLIVALFAAVYLLFGIALTSSRTSWVGLAIIVLAVWHWRGLWPARSLPLLVCGLALVFCMMVGFMPTINRVLLLTGETGGIDNLARLGHESRPQIWALFVDAALQKPWFGYGWNQVALAQMEVADQRPALHIFFAHSHNLFLDLMLWCGIPLGLLVSGFGLAWVWRRFRHVATAEAAVLLLFLVVMANHAMLELPLHHAYVLLPFGLVMGALDQRLGIAPIMQLPRAFAMLLWVTAFVLLSLIVRDYMRVERSYQALRFEWARIKSPPAEIPDVLLLSQWRDFVGFVKQEPAKGLDEAELESLRRIAALNPGAATLQKLAVVLALNGRSDEAALWLRRMCNTAPKSQCELVRKAWLIDAKTTPEIAAVRWPS